MKIHAIQTSNFLGAQAVDVKLTKPVALFAGKNFAGKSSLQEAVRMALTGESVRVGLKKDYGALVTEGQEAGFVEVITDDQSYSIVLPAGKGVHSDNAALRYVLDAQRFATMPDEVRRAFLFGLMGLRTDGAAVKERLTARGCDARKVEHIAPFLRAGFDAGQKEAQGKAREAKASWKTTTGGEAYGSVKAASYRATKPEVDTAKLEQARADLVAIENDIEVNTSRLGDLQARARQAGEQKTKLADLREKAGRFARSQDKLLRDEAELKEWEQKVEETKAKASGAPTEHPMTCPHCAGLVVHRPNIGGGELQPYETPAETIDREAAARLPEYEKSLALLQSCVTNGKRDVAAADAAARALRELEDGGLIEATSDEEIAALKDRIDTLKHDKKNQEAGIRMLEDSARLATEADEKTRRAASLHLDVQQWESIADALAPDGIPGEMLAEALDPINEHLTDSAGIAEWADVTITRDMQVLAGGRPYALLSESEKWRADAMIAEAIAHLSGMKLLVLDRFDVLDMKGREDLLIWLDTMAQEKQIDSALIFGTLKALPAQLPDTVAAFWIENGSTAQLKQAA